MRSLKVALLQIAAHGNDQGKNRAKGIEWCKKAKDLGADIALFPEMWNIGYTAFDPIVWKADYDPSDTKDRDAISEWQSQAIDQDSHFFGSFRDLARELRMAIVVTYLEKWSDAPRNSASLIDRHGEIVMTYAKVHTCDSSLEASCTPGDVFPVCDLDTALGAVRIGIMICYDREFPESARILMLNGAEIILTPNSCPLEQNRLGQFRTRAFENMVGLAMTNYPGPVCLGHSVAHTAIAFDARGPRDTTLVEATDEEGIWIAEFALEAIRDYRQRETWGNAYRKPRLYGKLVDTEVVEPFVRKHARR